MQSNVVGTCETRPDACIEILKPVCGCDGKPFPKPSPHQPSELTQHICSRDHLYKRHFNGLFMVSRLSWVCVVLWFVGKTYQNDCLAHQSGMSVRRSGACAAPSKPDNQPKPPTNKTRYHTKPHPANHTMDSHSWAMGR